MLTIYKKRSDVPKTLETVDNNDVFFNGFAKIPDTPLVSDILMGIDGAVRASDDTFVGRFTSGALDSSKLSTGTKTLLNVLQFPDSCFSMAECGGNVFDYLARISLEVEHAYILFEYGVMVDIDNPLCDIVVDDRHFSDFNDVAAYLYYGYVRGKEDDLC